MGSEMCIRDRALAGLMQVSRAQQNARLAGAAPAASPPATSPGIAQ